MEQLFNGNSKIGLLEMMEIEKAIRDDDKHLTAWQR